MALEEGNLKSSVSTVEEIKNRNPNSNEEEGDDDVEELEVEVGKIGGGDGDATSSSSQVKAVTYQPHPFEHSWTFWFDNPSAKSKQATWGSSMRSIYTFATVEEFWR